MPKLLVLFDSRSDELTRLAEAVAEGARRVRFAEVDLRRVDGASGATGRHRALEGGDAISAYDGIIVGADSSVAHEVTLDPLVAAPSLLNKVGAAFVAARPDETGRSTLWSALAPLADRGMILVATPVTDDSGDPLDSARALGQRVADVVGWVTHARSHHHHH
jgi:NAD(P)H dehydrogenase (quinone)